jgi:hypothetical protein
MFSKEKGHLTNKNNKTEKLHHYRNAKFVMEFRGTVSLFKISLIYVFHMYHLYFLSEPSLVLVIAINHFRIF